MLKTHYLELNYPKVALPKITHFLETKNQLMLQVHQIFKNLRQALSSLKSLNKLKMNKKILLNLELELIKSHYLQRKQLQITSFPELDRIIKLKLVQHLFLVVFRAKTKKIRKKTSKKLMFQMKIRVRHLKLHLLKDYSKLLNLKNPKPLIPTNNLTSKILQLLNKPK